MIALWVGSLAFFLFHPVDDVSKGLLGDSFGAINSLFSGLAFLGLIYTILLQQKELELTRMELNRTANAQEETQKALIKQLDVMVKTHELDREKHEAHKRRIKPRFEFVRIPAIPSNKEKTYILEIRANYRGDVCGFMNVEHIKGGDGFNWSNGSQSGVNYYNFRARILPTENLSFYIDYSDLEGNHYREKIVYDASQDKCLRSDEDLK